MIKTITLGTVLTAMYNQPTYSLLAIVSLLFIVQIIGELFKLKSPTNDSYEEIKELFKQMDSFDYSDEEEEAIAPSVKTNAKLNSLSRNKIELKVVPVNWKNYTYKDLQSLCKKFGIRANSKRYVLEQELLALCK